MNMTLENPTRIAIFSDLHLEFDRQGRKLWAEDTGHPGVGPRLEGLRAQVDIVVLAGDIDLGTIGVDYADIVSLYLEVPVILIAGNHEFYNQGRVDHTLDECRLAAMATDGRVLFLEKETVVVENTRFVGCVLWTDFQLFGKDREFYSMQGAARVMNDFRLITAENGKRFSPVNAAEEFELSVAYFRSELAKPFDGETIVITHTAPSRLSVHDRFKDDPLSPAFASNLDELVANSGAALWVHGHAHDSFDYTIGGTRVLCNPRGYNPHELNPDFDPAMVIRV